MNRKALFMLAVSSLVCVPSWAQTFVKPSANYDSSRSTFAIITDEATWGHCREALLAYQSLLTGEQLPSFIVYHDWKNPEQVKKVLRRLYQKNHLEGAVFVGHIPIPMIRQAQHLTSAFKMDERAFPWRDSSVPSDRFYDDFDLQFDFLKRDSVERHFFYYNLSARSPQRIQCDIYTGRIMPVASGKDYFKQINDYLAKVILAHKSQNKLDQFVSYTGEGSYSNSLTAWTQEAFTIREQLPEVFDRGGRAGFIRFSMFDYPKQTLLNTIRRDDLDLMIFHEHGTPDRQYVSGSPVTHDLSSHIKAFQYGLRSYARRYPKDVNGKDSTRYFIDTTWVAGYNSPETVKADSLQDAKTGILLPDVTRAQPNVRMVIFDACYNGDFREKDYIAGRYIFADGKTIVGFANTVNVLQDKQSNEMLGLLGMGARVGQWAQLTNILESHIIGDPTFRFQSDYDDVDVNALLQRPYEEATVLHWADSPYADVQNLALHLLYRHRYAHLDTLLKQKFKESPFAVVRYTSFSLLRRINGKSFPDILPKALQDPNEFIRRSAVLGMTKVGLDSYVPLLVREKITNRFSEREAFDILINIPVFSEKAFEDAIAHELRTADISDKDAQEKELRKYYGNKKDWDAAIFNPKSKPGLRRIYISSLKNIPNSASVDGYLRLILDKGEEEKTRLAMVESLAWFDASYRRDDIMKAVWQLASDKSASKSLRQAAERTYFRIKNRQE